MASPNPYRDPRPWGRRVILGGRLLKAILKSWDASLTDDWKKQKSKKSNGASMVFGGTNPVEDLKMTFQAPNAEAFDDLGDIWNMLAPLPVTGSAPAAATGTPQTSAVGSPPATAKPFDPFAALAQAQSALAALDNPTKPAATTDPTSSAVAAPADDPGPRPPTVTIQHAGINFLGVFAVARKSWKGPYPVAGNSWEVEIEFVHDRPPTPAGAGTMTAAQAIFGGAGGSSPQASADAAKSQANADAAGT